MLADKIRNNGGEKDFFLSAYGGGLLASTDGKNWTLKNAMTLTGAYLPSRVVYAKDEWILTLRGASVSTFKYSRDNGETWITVSQNEVSDSSESTMGAAYGNGKYVVMGNYCLWTSTNGTTWSRTWGKGNDYSGFEFIDGYFHIISVYNGSNGEQIAYSADASTWTNFMMNTGVYAGVDACDMAYGNGKYVIIGGGSNPGSTDKEICYSSTRTGTYTVALEPSWTPRRVIFGGGKFIVVGYSGYAYVSSNGTSWSTAYLGISDAIDVAYGNGLYVAVGYKNDGTKDCFATSTSPDGVTWTPTTTGFAGRGYAIGHGGTPIL